MLSLMLIVLNVIFLKKEIEMELADLLLSNWEVIGLIFTNILALFKTPPGKKVVPKDSL